MKKIVGPLIRLVMILLVMFLFGVAVHGMINAGVDWTVYVALSVLFVIAMAI